MTRNKKICTLRRELVELLKLIDEELAESVRRDRKAALLHIAMYYKKHNGVVSDSDGLIFKRATPILLILEKITKRGISGLKEPK